MLKNWDMVPVMLESAVGAADRMDAARDAGAPFALVISDVNMPEMQREVLTS